MRLATVLQLALKAVSCDNQLLLRRVAIAGKEQRVRDQNWSESITDSRITMSDDVALGRSDPGLEERQNFWNFGKNQIQQKDSVER